MGIFSTMGAAAVAVDESAVLNNNLEISSAVLETTNYTAAAFEIVAESESNYNSIMKAIGIHELAYFEEHGEEIVYEEGGLANFFEKVKQFFITLGNKIKDLFEKFMTWIASKTKETSAFAKKYGPKAKEKFAELDDFTFKGWKFKTTNVDIKVVHDKAVAEIKSEFGITGDLDGADIKDAVNGDKVEALKTTVDKIANADVSGVVRTKILGAFGAKADGETNASGFNKALTEFFMGAEKVELKKAEIKVDEIVAQLENYATLKNFVKDNFKELKGIIDKAIKGADDVAKGWKKADVLVALGDNSEDGKKQFKATLTAYASSLVTINRTVKQDLTVANGALLQALKDEANQNKSIIAAILAAKTKKADEKKEDAKEESKPETKEEPKAEEKPEAAQEAASMSFLDAVVLK